MLREGLSGLIKICVQADVDEQEQRRRIVLCPQYKNIGLFLDSSTSEFKSEFLGLHLVDMTPQHPRGSFRGNSIHEDPRGSFRGNSKPENPRGSFRGNSQQEDLLEVTHKRILQDNHYRMRSFNSMRLQQKHIVCSQDFPVSATCWILLSKMFGILSIPVGKRKIGW